MVVIRPTQKVRRYLSGDTDALATSDTALGDWYVNRLVVDRQPLLILVSSTSLLAVLTPARSVRTLPGRLSELVSSRLDRLEIPREIIDREISTMLETSIAAIASRSVLGTMVEFGKHIPTFLPEGGWGEPELAYAERMLAKTPCRNPSGGEHIFPENLAPRLLKDRWLPQASGTAL